MATQLLIYETAVPVTQARHGSRSIEVGADYAFSARLNSVPLMAVEFPIAAAEYVIVFGGTGDVVMPAVILGLRAEQNLFLGADGSWGAKYVPAFLRRYPFVFSSRDDGKTFTLCIDEGYAGLNDDGRGERLFGDDRKPSPYVDNVLKFLQQYQLEFNRTQSLCKKLKDLNLLEPMQAQISLDSGEKMSLTGFSVVNRARLKTLSADVLAELLRADELELIFNHLMSMRNFGAMRELAGGQAAATGTDAAMSEAAPPVGKAAKGTRKH